MIISKKGLLSQEVHPCLGRMEVEETWLAVTLTLSHQGKGVDREPQSLTALGERGTGIAPLRSEQVLSGEVAIGFFHLQGSRRTWSFLALGEGRVSSGLRATVVAYES
jgi:hypothetical protein